MKNDTVALLIGFANHKRIIGRDRRPENMIHKCDILKYKCTALGIQNLPVGWLHRIRMQLVSVLINNTLGLELLIELPSDQHSSNLLGPSSDRIQP